MKGIYLSLGTNLGDREMNLVEARDLLMKHDVLVMGQSEVMETEPLGGKDQPSYLNQVVEVQCTLQPEDLLRVCKQVEKEMGRDVVVPMAGNVSFGLGATKPNQDEPDRWESRVIDVDILFYNDLKMNGQLLTLPHHGWNRPWNLDGMRDLGVDLEG